MKGLRVHELAVGTRFTVGNSKLEWRVFFRTAGRYQNEVVQIENDRGTTYTLTAGNKTYWQPAHVTRYPREADTRVNRATRPVEVGGVEYMITLLQQPLEPGRDMRRMLVKREGELLARLDWASGIGWQISEPVQLAGVTVGGPNTLGVVAVERALELLAERPDYDDITREDVMAARQRLTDLKRDYWQAPDSDVHLRKVERAAAEYIRVAHAHTHKLGKRPTRLTIAGLLR